MASVARHDGRSSIWTSPRLMLGDRNGTDPLAAFRAIADRDRGRSLSALIENEIIPRLMVAHAPGTPPPTPVANAGGVFRPEIEALAQLALGVEADALLAQVDAVLARGLAIDTVMIDLLAPAARLLGEYWEDDRCDFVDVTMALWRLQQIVHEIAARSPGARAAAATSRRALFASMPGDQHDFGTVVIDELFRRDGWLTTRLSAAETPELLRRAGGEWFDLIGLTVTCDCHIAPLPSILIALRSVSCNPRVCIMVGGRIFNADPDLAGRVGADGTAPDAKRAIELASDLVRARHEEALALG